MGSRFPIGGSQSATTPDADAWSPYRAAGIEDLQEAVLGAGLRATQMSRGPLNASLAFSSSGGVVHSSGYIGSRVELTGSLSDSLVTLGLGVVLRPGTRHWLREVDSGDMGIFLPGDEHDSLYVPGSIYACVSAPVEQIQERAAFFDLSFDPFALGGTGVYGQRLNPELLASFQDRYSRFHAGWCSNPAYFDQCGLQLLDAMILHMGREPRSQVGSRNPRGQERVVARARAFIHDNLNQSLSVEKIAKAASASQRTLHRAFLSVLGETPYSYTLKVRLHRIRNSLISDDEILWTVTAAANRWGVAELGRFAGRDEKLFGELPSQTHMRNRSRVSGKFAKAIREGLYNTL